MRFMSVSASLAFAAALATGAAHAQDSGSFSIQVNIPPLGAAMAAQDAGAVGSWTVTSPAGGLMIGADADHERLIIYRADTNRFDLVTFDGRSLPVERRTESRGLTALEFDRTMLGANGESRVGLVIVGL